MTETKAPCAVQDPWTAALPADWPPPVDRTLIVPPPSVTEWYVIDDDGKLHVREDNETAFRGLWDHLCRMEAILPRAIGNVLNHAELAFRDPCPACNAGMCLHCQGWGYIQSDEHAPKVRCDLCGGSGKCPDCIGYGTVEGTLYVEMAEKAGRKIGTLRQYKRVYNPFTGVSPDRQRSGVKYSYDREVAPLPPAQQDVMLDRIQAGEFQNSDQVHAERKRIQHEPPREKFASIPDIPCPFCGGEHGGWKREEAHWSECKTCGSHGDEAIDHLLMLQTAVLHLYTCGDRGPLDEYVKTYHVL
jgi:hypothetical protein